MAWKRQLGIFARNGWDGRVPRCEGGEDPEEETKKKARTSGERDREGEVREGESEGRDAVVRRVWSNQRKYVQYLQLIGHGPEAGARGEKW